MKIVLVDPKIPPNTGTIARLSAANYLQLDLVGDLGFSLDDAQLKRAGLDYWPEVEYRHFPDRELYMDSLDPEKSFLFTTKVDSSYTEACFSEDSILIFGSETTGLSESYLKRYSDRCYTIPMANPNIRSLNLSNSVSIVVYEALRQVSVKS